MDPVGRACGTAASGPAPAGELPKPSELCNGNPFGDGITPGVRAGTLVAGWPDGGVAACAGTDAPLSKNCRMLSTEL